MGNRGEIYIAPDLRQSDPRVAEVLLKAQEVINRKSLLYFPDKYVANMEVFASPTGLLAGGKNIAYFDSFDETFFDFFLSYMYDDKTKSSTKIKKENHHIKRNSGKGLIPKDLHFKDNVEEYLNDPILRKQLFSWGVYPGSQIPRYEPKHSEISVTTSRGNELTRTVKEDVFPFLSAARRRIVYALGDPLNTLMSTQGSAAKPFTYTKSCFFMPFSIQDFSPANNMMKTVADSIVLRPPELLEKKPEQADKFISWNGFLVSKAASAGKPIEDSNAMVFMDISGFDKDQSGVYMEKTGNKILGHLAGLYNIHLTPSIKAYFTALNNKLNMPLMEFWDDEFDDPYNIIGTSRLFLGYPSGKWSVGIEQVVLGCYLQLKFIWKHVLNINGRRYFRTFENFVSTVVHNSDPNVRFFTWGDDVVFSIPSRFLAHYDSWKAVDFMVKFEVEENPRFLGHIWDDVANGWTPDIRTSVTNRLAPEGGFYSLANPAASFEEFWARLFTSTLGIELATIIRTDLPELGANFRETGLPTDLSRALWDNTYTGEFDATKFITVSPDLAREVFSDIIDNIEKIANRPDIHWS